mmetsp:Transcript_57753/g.137442  ORF Transcript_57753/g.137442 Transcript_57753/m.137442 type:complete len:201 (+) Transcript_57753:536-1138(+)
MSPSSATMSRVSLALATRTSISSAAPWASRAACLVTHTRRRMPLAVPSSPITAKSIASRVLSMWVPPQNSTESWSHSSLSGVARSCSTVCFTGPTETTRTGSGYTSPKTARSDLICFASASGTSLRWESNSPLITSRTSLCTLSTSSTVMGLLYEKSKRSLSGPTIEPRWSIWCPSRTLRRAQLSKWVVVWLAATADRRS